ncbi:MAG: hypothetical protein ACOX3P_00995 [Saccharofermentanales bacterium]|nr:hypothetical protein [Bacillota bacterium]
MDQPMEGLDKIIARIIADARATAARIEAEAEEKATGMIAAAETTADEILENSRTRTKEDAANILARGESLVRSEHRKDNLQKRQLQVEDLIEAALDKLASDPAEEKVDRYLQMIKSRELTGGEIMLPEVDQELGPSLLGQLGDKFTLASAAGNFRAGLVVRQGRIEDNLTYDLAIRNSRAELAQLAAELLEKD